MTVKARIYKLTALSQTDATAPEKVDFGDDQNAMIIGFSWQLSRKYTDNGSPGIDVARKPDTGFKVGKCALDVVFKLDSATVPTQIAQLLKWTTGKNISSVFPEGQFGIRIDKVPTFNTKPTATSGFKVSDFVFQWVGKNQTYANGQIILEYSGDGANIGG